MELVVHFDARDQCTGVSITCTFDVGACVSQSKWRSLEGFKSKSGHISWQS